jgi:Zn-dependent peptidase ImmA (M78 family)
MKKFRPQFIKKENIWRMADDFRSKYWDESIPVDIEEIIEFGLEIEIEPRDGLRERCKKDAILVYPLRIIIDNGYLKQPRFQNRVRFSLAHEIGHLIVHKDLVDLYPFESEDDYLRFNDSLSDQEYNWMEWQAHEFAGRLLVPPPNI